MNCKVTLVDVNPKMIAAWKDTFENNPEVEVLHGSMLDQAVQAWVSPTNSKGSMDGGLDAVIKNHLGGGVEKSLQQTIKAQHGGHLPIGYAVCTPTNLTQPKYLISTPTMVASSEDVSQTMNVAMACAAAFQAVNLQNHHEPGSIRSVALPGLGANTGRVPVEICADLMWTGYNLFTDGEYRTYEQLRMALESVVGKLDPMSGSVPSAKPATDATPAAAAAAAATGDFDDFDDAGDDTVVDDDIGGDDDEDDDDFDDFE